MHLLCRDVESLKWIRLFKTEAGLKKLREDFQVLTNLLLELRTGSRLSQHGEAGKRCANAACPSQH